MTGERDMALVDAEAYLNLVADVPNAQGIDWFVVAQNLARCFRNLDAASERERDVLRERVNAGWTENICAHSHRWRSEDKSRRCPVCGTSTFRAVLSRPATPLTWDEVRAHPGFEPGPGMLRCPCGATLDSMAEAQGHAEHLRLSRPATDKEPVSRDINESRGPGGSY